MPLSYNVRAFQSAPLTLEVNAKPALEKLARLGAGMRNPSPPVQGLAKAMRQHIRTAFAVGGYPHAWAPNRPNTVAAKGHSRVLHRSRGRGRSGLEAATSVTVSEVGRELAITMHTSALGRFHQEGRKGPWTIAPHGNYPLRFQVAGQNVGGRAVTGAEGRAVFQKRRARAQARRAATGRGRIPGRQYGVTVYALSVQHPGYPARPFLPDVNPHSPAGDAFLQAHWRVPLRDYLFGGTK